MTVFAPNVIGVDVDRQTRCAHWHSELDIIAIRFKCCGVFYSCFECHAELAQHATKAWPANERDANAVLCGACGHQLTIEEYFGCDSTCPNCKSNFNPACAKHYHLYFE